MKRLWQIQVTPQYADAPHKSVIPVSIWALAFSLDGRSLAFAAGFIESSKPIPRLGSKVPFRSVEYPFKSYVFIVDTRQPEVSKKRFEIKMPPYLNRPTMMWSPNADAIAFQSVSLLEHEHEVHLLRVSDGMERSLDVGRCNLRAVLAGFRVVAQCSDNKERKYYVRIFSVDGTVEHQVEVPGIVSIRAIDGGTGRMVIDATLSSASIGGQSVTPHEIVLVGLDGKEQQRWVLPETWWYDGVFAESGKRYCAVPRSPIDAKSYPKTICWSVSTGERVSQLTMRYQTSPDGTVRAGGLRISVPEADVHLVPKVLQRLAETSWYYGKSRRVIYDLQSGNKIAEWENQTQHLLPKPASTVIGDYPYSIAPDGNAVAEGGDGVVTLYQLQ